MQARNPYLLDTNILIAYFDRDAVVRRHLSHVDTVISAAVAGELLFGAFNSDQRALNLETFRGFLRVQRVLPCDLATADLYGMIAAEMEQRGTRIKQNDMWIAAHALQYGLTVASRDNHFEPVQVLGLRWEVW